MLSILIPTYNCNVLPLVLELQKQANAIGMKYEILCQDDYSNHFLNENQKINTIENCSFSRNNSNLGRSKNRNHLAEKAQNEWLLFMDCDTFPPQDNFIQNYVSEINKEEKKVVFGGITYQKEKPESKQLLRWVYGNARETIPVEKRNSNPYSTALTSNLLLKKEVFIANPFDESITKYGYEDLVFLADLKKKGILVKHIDNPTFHLGLESSKEFLEKTKTALENLKIITTTATQDHTESKLFRTYSLLNRFYLANFVGFLFKKFGRKIQDNLLSHKPSLLLFDLFKLGYFCTLKD
jgi:glycosyltransferase involved in cell wall biosynthesis